MESSTVLLREKAEVLKDNMIEGKKATFTSISTITGRPFLRGADKETGPSDSPGSYCGTYVYREYRVRERVSLLAIPRK